MGIADGPRNAIPSQINTPQAPVPTPPTATAHVEQICDIYKALAGQGFAVHDVERALLALPLHTIAIGSALDWLLLHLDRSDLPKQYADQVQNYGEVELRHKAAETSAQKVETSAAAAKAAAAAAAEKAAAEKVEADGKAAAAAVAAAEAEAKRKADEEREQASRRAWILQYADDSSDDEEESSSERSHGSDKASIIEDWEIWGDPREVDRRRAERARGALPRDDRLELIAMELSKTMQGAAQAKASGDKAEQRTYGQMIGQLKREMAELGVTEKDLPPLGGGASSRIQKTEETENEESNNPSAESLLAPPTTTTTHVKNDNDSSAEQQALGYDDSHPDGSKDSRSDSERSSEDDDLGFDIFDGGGTIDALENVPGADARSRRRAKAMAAAALQPWGAGENANSGGKKKGGGKSGAEPKGIVVQQPKAVLQQICQGYGWNAPRYERLPPGGNRDPSEKGGELRYAVIVDPGTTNTSSSSKKKGRKERSKLSAKRTFSVPDGDDGWARIEDAQNAAATRALLDLVSDDNPELWRQLPTPFNELWLAWDEEGLAGMDEEESEEAATVREAFVRDLVSYKLQQESLEEQALAQEVKEKQEQVPWAESLKRRLAQRQRNPKVAATEAATSKRMLEKLQSFRNSAEGIKWQKARDGLPAAMLREQLKERLATQDVIVVSGETGSGKTTQVPQFLLEIETEAGQGGACSVVCTQPRRIAAISVAERVSSERGEPAPGERGAAVGYAVRLDSATSADTKLLFCTTGILLRRLASDPALASVTHVVVDEVHERTLQGDFLIALLKDLVGHRRAAGYPLKVILMSATLDSDLIASYFGGCPTLHAPGRTFPVEQLFLEDAMEVTGYVLAPDAPAALRPGGARRDRQRRLENAAGARNKMALRAGWGDDEADEVLNPHYDDELYEDYRYVAGRRICFIVQVCYLTLFFQI